MRDGNVPRFFCAAKRGRAGWWAQLVGQLAAQLIGQLMAQLFWKWIARREGKEKREGGRGMVGRGGGYLLNK